MYESVLLDNSRILRQFKCLVYRQKTEGIYVVFSNLYSGDQTNNSILNCSIHKTYKQSDTKNIIKSFQVRITEVHPLKSFIKND